MRILIIEDDEKFAQTLKYFLEKEGYVADVVTDGESGEKRIELYHNEYDMAIVDWLLPKKQGIEVCKAARSKNIALPILMLTGRDAIEDKVMGLESGADDYLTKPFSSDELHARIKALMRRPPALVPQTLAAKDLVLNSAKRQVCRNGGEITLTLKEYSILEYFMRHPNAVLNREQILDNVWDFEESGFSNVVDVHVNHLRRKLNRAGNINLLETVRGVGYRLRA